MSYSVKSILIIIAVAVVSFFVAQAVLPDRHAVTERDLQRPARQGRQAPKPAVADIPVVTVDAVPAENPIIIPENRRDPVNGGVSGNLLGTATPPVSAPAPDTAAPRPRAQRAAASSPLKVERSAVCTAVVDRAPVGASDRFSSETAQIFFFTHITGARDTAQIAHRWYRDGMLVQTSRREVKSPSWRTHTRRVLGGAADAGSWKVEVVDTKTGTVLGSASFTIE
jgi:hypothetical protein